ncbi:AMP-binding protein [Actibacterium sp. D379-3]
MTAPRPPFDTPHDPERVFAIQPTGGTTGRSKGVMIPNRSLEITVASFVYCMPPKSRPVFLAVAPLTHAAGMIAQSVLVYGGQLVIYKGVDKQDLLNAIPEYGITQTFLPPTVIYELLHEANVRDVDYSSLQYLIYGAALMAPDRLRDALGVFGPVMCQIYSQTEMAVPATFLPPQDHYVNGEIAPRERLSSCGRASAFIKVAVMDGAGNVLPDGEMGEICMYSIGGMLGYYKQDDATSEAFRDGWLRTGDMGLRDAEGIHPFFTFWR